MTNLTAPAPRTFPTVEQGTYTGVVDRIDVEDCTQIADKFGYRGIKLIFRWRLEGVASEEGDPITLPQYVKLETGDRPYSKGPRAGRLPWLTEITRAFGEPDIQPGDGVDPDLWVGKRARLAVLEQAQADGTSRNAINAVGPAKPRTGQAAAPAKPAPKPAPTVAEDLDPEGDTPF